MTGVVGTFTVTVRRIVPLPPRSSVTRTPTSVVRPKLREWEARWWRMARDNNAPRARLGVALREISRLTDRG